MPDEPSHGAFMRLSARNGARSPKQLAVTLGVSMRAVLAGHHIEKIEAWAGLPSDSLAQFSARPNHITRIVDLKNEKIALGDWSIRQRRICPLCICEDCDIAKSIGLPAEAIIHHRGYWDVNSIACCHKHHVSLLANCVRCHRPLGWADPAIGKCSSGCNLAPAAQTIAADEFNQYLASRLGFGTAPNQPQLDCLEYRHVVRFCELLGILKLQEWSKKMPSRSPSGAAEARRDGFLIAKDLIRNLAPLLDKILAASRAESQSNGIIAAYGWVYSQWASEDTPVAKTIQSILRNHAVANGVIAPQEPILGFNTSVTLTIQQIRLRLGSGHNSTRRRLSAIGCIPKATRRGVKSAIDLSAVRAIQDMPPEADLGTRMVGKKLGVGRGCARDILVLGLIDEIKYGRSIVAIDEFAKHLIAKCSAIPPGEARSLREAAKSRNIRLAHVLSAIAADQLSVWLAPKSSKKPLAERLMVLPCQIQAGEDKAVPVTKAAKILSLHPEAVSLLLATGFLSRINGRGLCPDSIIRFDQHFIALAPLAHARNTSSRALVSTLNSQGIRPAFAPPEFRQILYRRRDLEKYNKCSAAVQLHG